MSAADAARQAHAAAEQARQRAEDFEVARAEHVWRAREARAFDVIRRSPLHDWFGDTEWEVVSYSAHGVAAGYSDGSAVVVSDPDRSVTLLVEDWDHGVKVFVVERTTDGESGNDFFDGPEVDSLEAVGAVLAARETHAG